MFDRNNLTSLEEKRSVLRRVLKDHICVPVALRNYKKINEISEELEVLREEAGRLKRK